MATIEWGQRRKLKLFDLPDDGAGSNFVLWRAGTGTTPSAPPPPGS
jgi:hypothetical protein